MGISIGFCIQGLENCDISEQKITGLDSELFEKAVLIKINDTMIYSAFFTVNHNLDQNEFEREKDKIIKSAKEAIKKLIAILLLENIDIIEWSISEPSICIAEPGHMTVSNSVTIQSIDNGIQTKRYEKIDFDLKGNEINDKQQKIVDILNVPDRIVRYEMLYEVLKQECGGRQINVTQKIKREYPNICTNNLNINKRFRRGLQRYQDDFTYLRTLISHGRKEHYEEIVKRIDRDINRIVNES